MQLRRNNSEETKIIVYSSICLLVIEYIAGFYNSKMLFLNTSSVIILLLLGVNTITGYVANSCYRTNHAFKSNKITSSRRYLAEELDVGEVENIKFTKIGEMGSDLNKYRIEGTIKSKQLNVYLEQYKDEMRSRKVIFPGFRPGKLPPYVMPDIRKYIISFGLETIFVELCNLNNLIVSHSN